MYISARERQILDILLSVQDEMTVKDLADHIGVSGRTVHRDLKNVEDILEEYQLSLQKKSGVGVQVIGEKSKIRELELFLFNLYHTEYTPDERQTMILCALLESQGPVKLISLANDLNVTIATVSSDLTKIEERIQPIGLTLIRRRGYGVEIEGPEGSKRRALRDIIAEQLDESEILSLARENIQKRSSQHINTISERLLGLVEKNKLMIVEKVIESFSRDLPFSMADSSYIGLVVHLALAIERIQKGEGIVIDPEYLENQKKTKEYVIAEKIVAELEKVLEILIPEAEIGYITMHLKGAKLRHDKEYLMEDSSLQAAIKTKNLIQYVGKSLGRDLSQNHSLFEGLAMHLKPVLYRLSQNMGISNPLLGRIKRDYQELFLVVKEACEEVFFEYPVPETEIGYLVMHFGAAVLGDNQDETIKTLVLCSSGIGTSKMLVTRLQNEFPELQEIKSASLLEINRADTADYQLIISTIPIPDSNRDYLLVSPILNKDEISKIRAYIDERFATKGFNRQKEQPGKKIYLSQKSVETVIKEMRSVQDYADVISAILQEFEIKEIKAGVGTETILVQACQTLFEKQLIADVEMVVSAVVKRERLGGLGIPGTTMALFHARSDQVIKPCFTIYALPEPIKVQGMDESLMDMKQLVLLLSPEVASENVLEVLSFLSSTLIESEEITSIFESNDQERILALLVARLEQFFNEKLLQIRSE